MVHKIEMTPEERRSVWKAGLGLSTTKVVQPKWKLIETAPKDGRHILAWMAGGAESRPHYSLIYWFDFGHGGSWTTDLPGLGSDHGYEDSAFTHWMELPAPPDIIGEQIIREEEEAEIRRELDFEDEFPHGLEGDE